MSNTTIDLNEDFYKHDIMNKCPYPTEEEAIKDLKRIFVVKLSNCKDKQFCFKNYGYDEQAWLSEISVKYARESLNDLPMLRELVQRTEYFEKGQVINVQEKYKITTAWQLYLKYPEKFGGYYRS